MVNPVLKNNELNRLEQKFPIIKIAVNLDEKKIVALIEFWGIVSEAFRNPLSEENSHRLETCLGSMFRQQEHQKIFEMLEREIQLSRSKSTILDIRKDEADAFFAYTSIGKTEDKINAMVNLQQDVKKCAEAIEVFNANIEKIDRYMLAKIIESAEKYTVKTEEIKILLGKNADPELVDAICVLVNKQEAASVAARNIFEIDRNVYDKIFGIASRNEVLGVLMLYKRMLGDTKFVKVRESAMHGELAVALAQIKKMGIAAQYLFFSMLAPLLMRNGMWDAKNIGIVTGVLEIIRKKAIEKSMNTDWMQFKFIYGASKFLSRFADFRGLNFSFFSAGFLLIFR